MKTAFSWPPFLAGLLAGILFGGIGGYLIRQSNVEADAEAAGRAFIRGMEPTPEEKAERAARKAEWERERTAQQRRFQEEMEALKKAQDEKRLNEIAKAEAKLAEARATHAKRKAERSENKAAMQADLRKMESQAEEIRKLIGALPPEEQLEDQVSLLRMEAILQQVRYKIRISDADQESDDLSLRMMEQAAERLKK